MGESSKIVVILTISGECKLIYRKYGLGES
jgi:hypothetical protein